MLGDMRWPWSAKSNPHPPILSGSLAPKSDDVQKYARDVLLHLHDQGVTALDLAAAQSSFEWTKAFTDLGRAYLDSANGWMAITERLGILPEPIEFQSP